MTYFGKSLRLSSDQRLPGPLMSRLEGVLGWRVVHGLEDVDLVNVENTER